jgi:hypothetical protein
MKWALRALRWSYCAFIAWASWQTFQSAHFGHEHHALILSSIELIAIIAFPFERSELPAAVVLIGVYAIAAVITMLDEQVPIRFVFFAVTAFYIVYSRRVMKTGNSSVG